jgi:spermidine/putrescine transport system permease protein
MKNSLSRKLADKPYILWAALFIIAPLIMVVYYTFTNSQGAFTLDNVTVIPQYTSVILLSIIYGVIATVICLLIGYPFAYFISKLSTNSQAMMVLLVMLPMWMNFLIRTYSWMTILGDSGVINGILSAVGLLREVDGELVPLHMLNTPGAVMLGMVYNFLPYMILPIYSVLTKMDESLIEAAQDLGSGKSQVIRRVILPLSLPGVLSGLLWFSCPAFQPSISPEARRRPGCSYRDIIETQFQQANNYNLGASLSLILMVLILACLWIMNYLGADDETERGSLYEHSEAFRFRKNLYCADYLFPLCTNRCYGAVFI